MTSVADATSNDLLFANGGDDNRGIETVEYNTLNLPQRIAGGGQEIQYVYDATGAKLAKTGSGGTQYYAGAMVYDETDLSYLLHDEGVVRIGHSGEARSYTYFYHLKDHLGNTRVEFQANPDNSYQVTQRQSYYPFGLRFEVAPAGENEYLYNGKEIQEDLIAGRSLGWYDYGARMYDAALGRFHKQDRFAEKYYDFSPYNYAANNPIKNIDVNGDSIWVSITTPSINSDGYTTTQTTDYYYGEDADGNSGFIGPDGKIYSGNNSFVNKTAAAIDYLRQGKDGKSLVDDLITSVNSTEIIATNGSNKAEKNNGDYIKFNPNGFKGGVDQYGSTTRLPAFGLAHEMAHVQDLWNGTVSNGPWQYVTLPNGTIRTIENNEINATHVENKIRAENGRPLRAIYGDRLIISPATNNSIYYNQNGATNYSPIESTQRPYIYK